MLNALRTFDSDIKEGARYRRAAAGSVTETAQVIGIAPDNMGIPHVRFQLHVARGTDKRTEQRTLALDIFYARYRERV